MSDVATYLAAIEADPTIDNVAKYIGLLENCLPDTNDELRSCLNVFVAARKTGSCHVMYERYIRNDPLNWDIRLDYAQFKTGLGSPTVSDFYYLTSNIEELDLTQRIRLADLMKNTGRYEDSIDIVSSLHASHPDEPSALKVLICCVIGMKQGKKARLLLQKYVKKMGNTVSEWSFVVDEVSKLGDEDLFTKWAGNFEAVLPANDGWSRFVLVTSYGRFLNQPRLKARCAAKIDQLMAEIDVSDLESQWMLSVLYGINEGLGLHEHLVRVARRLLILKQSDSDLMRKCHAVVNAGRQVHAIF